LPGGLDMLGEWWVLGLAAALYLIEFVADKIPAVDSAWDAIRSGTRIGALGADVSQSPCLSVSLSPCLPVPLSFFHLSEKFAGSSFAPERLLATRAITKRRSERRLR
jgi:uncharacterized protein DUF4126